MGKHNLHQAQSHEVLRSWQSQRNDINNPVDFVLPMFIGNDDDLVEAIPSMPDVCRYGANSAISYLEPLVFNHGLKAVLLFPVMTKSDQVKFREEKSLRRDGDASDDDEDFPGPEVYASSDSSPQYSQHSSSSSDSSDDDAATYSAIGSRPMDESPAQASALTSQNPFLNQNEEEEDHLLGADNSQQPPLAARSVLSSRVSLPKISRIKDVQLIRGMALKDKHNPVLRLIPRLREKFPDLLIICDVCLCAFTSTGHCCLFEDHSVASGLPTTGGPGSGSVILNQFPISNKVTCQYLAMLAVVYARRGCNVVAPSDMMDGRISIIREELKKNGLQHVAILSYSAKFASAFYGPFRQATNNAPQFGDRRAYQLPPGSRALALRAVQRDIEQGADLIMVKPAGPYLDIVRDIRELYPNYQIAVYQVSGEYSTLKVAAQAGVLDLKRAANEVLTSYRRSGATVIISYFTPAILRGEI